MKFSFFFLQNFLFSHSNNIFKTIIANFENSYHSKVIVFSSPCIFWILECVLFYWCAFFGKDVEVLLSIWFWIRFHLNFCINEITAYSKCLSVGIYLFFSWLKGGVVCLFEINLIVGFEISICISICMFHLWKICL